MNLIKVKIVARSMNLPPSTRKRKMKRSISFILAITLMAVPANSIAHKETWAEYDQRLEKEIAELQDELPMGSMEGDDSLKISKVEKNGKIISMTLETKGEFGWLAMAEEMGGLEKYKAQQQRYWVRQALVTSGLQLARRYTLRYIYVDNGKKIFSVDVSSFIIMSMVMNDDDYAYTPSPLEGEEMSKYDEYEKYLKDGGYPPAGLTPEEIHKFREFFKYKKY
jgi:hypothetical protein